MAPPPTSAPPQAYAQSLARAILTDMNATYSNALLQPWPGMKSSSTTKALKADERLAEKFKSVNYLYPVIIALRAALGVFCPTQGHCHRRGYGELK
jgi:hypothetical protein